MNNDKKKTMVLAILGLALIAVGAFQFLPKGKATPAPTVAAATTSGGTATAQPAAGQAQPGGAQTQANPGENKELDPQKEVLLAMVKDPLAKRDPFAPQAELEAVSTVPKLATAAPVAQQKPSGQRPVRMGGTVPPFDPTGGLPPGTGGATGPVGLDGGSPLRQPGEFAYSMKGVIVGNKPMAVFEDDNGNQRLVPLGGSVDRDTQVVGIEKGKVRIRHRGKDKTLHLPEGP